MRHCIMQTEKAEVESMQRKAGRRAATKAGLYAIMACMRDVRVRTEHTDAMFAPLHETIAVLHKYGIQVRTGAWLQTSSLNQRCDPVSEIACQLK